MTAKDTGSLLGYEMIQGLIFLVKMATVNIIETNEMTKSLKFKWKASTVKEEMFIFGKIEKAKIDEVN